MIDYRKLKTSLELLCEQTTRIKSLPEDYEPWIRDALEESIIQRFETCWDCLWKVLKRYLEEEIGLPASPNGPNPILRSANENRLLPTPIERWLAYGKARIATAHDYSGTKAVAALRVIDDFVDDAIVLYQSLSGERWQWRHTKPERSI